MDAVAPKAGDVVLPKTRHNFFAWTELGPVLRSLRVERLIVAGLQTDVCVEATVRAGLEHNFSVAVAENAVSTDGPDLHFASLNSMRVIYVEVGTWRELIKPNAPWDRAFRTPHYGRNPEYWSCSSKAESAALRLSDHRDMSGGDVRGDLRRYCQLTIEARLFTKTNPVLSGG
ncbi:cysteine hydrolase [Nocardia salmonicida]|uniref:Cysteine hydrolase n=1 Tax=Nocardia salmonicida TaxID=53431 RepID=A0ABZ1N104_9NOCA